MTPSPASPSADPDEASAGELLNMLRPFAFFNSPESFLSADGGCTETLIDDADVQRVRALFGKQKPLMRIRFSPMSPKC